jgi:hypothetical protein
VIAGDRVLPHDLDAERSVLGAVLLENDLYARAAAILQAPHFFRLAHRYLWHAYTDLAAAGQPIDVRTLQDRLARSGHLEEVGGPVDLAALTDGVPRTVNVAYYAGIVVERALQRDLIDIASKAIAAACDGDQPVGQIIEQTGAAIATIGRGTIETGTPSSRPRFRSAIEFMHEAPPMEIIEGIASDGGVTSLIAESGAGKTFVTLSMSAAVTGGRSWAGRRTERGGVAYVTFEGDAIGLRCRAVAEGQQHDVADIQIVRASAPLSPKVTRDGVEVPSAGELVVGAALDALPKTPTTRLVVFDTVRASLAGSEDGSDNAAAYLRAVRRLLARLPGAAAIIVHHSGWMDGDAPRRRERGSSAWRGNVDAALYLEAGEYDQFKGEAPLVLRTAKVRDAEPAPPLHLIRRRVTLSVCDRHDKPYTSCVIEPDPRSRAEVVAEQAEQAMIANRALDIRVLHTIATQPTLSTSQIKLSKALGVRKELVGDSLKRLVRLGWTSPGGNGKPYVTTARGLDVLALEQIDDNGSRGSQAVPGTVPANGSRFPPYRGTGAGPIDGPPNSSREIDCSSPSSGTPDIDVLGDRCGEIV